MSFIKNAYTTCALSCQQGRLAKHSLHQPKIHNVPLQSWLVITMPGSSITNKLGRFRHDVSFPVLSWIYYHPWYTMVMVVCWIQFQLDPHPCQLLPSPFTIKQAWPSWGTVWPMGWNCVNFCCTCPKCRISSVPVQGMCVRVIFLVSRGHFLLPNQRRHFLSLLHYFCPTKEMWQPRFSVWRHAIGKALDKKSVAFHHVIRGGNLQLGWWCSVTGISGDTVLPRSIGVELVDMSWASRLHYSWEPEFLPVPYREFILLYIQPQ
jgi:hypothetical protein